MVLCAVGGVIIGFSSTWFWLIFGFVLMNIGWSLYSGCAEAFAYDSLVDHHQSEHYDRVISHGYLLSTISFAVTTLIGGALFLLHFRLPHIVWGAFYVIGLGAFFFAVEPLSKRAERMVLQSNFFEHIKEGISIVRHTQVRKVLLFVVLLQSLYFMYSEGFLLPSMAMHFGLDSSAQSVLFASISVIAGFCASLLPHYRKRLKIHGLTPRGIILT